MPSPESGILFEESAWPLLLIRAPGTVTTRQQAEGLASIAAYLRRGEKFIGIVDMRSLGQVPPEQRHRQLEWFREHESLIHETLLGLGLVIHSPIVRLAMSVIFHFKPLPVPHITVSDVSTAAAWAAQRFLEAGLPQAATRVREHFPGS
jgi:hypothetical protein